MSVGQDGERRDGRGPGSVDERGFTPRVSGLYLIAAAPDEHVFMAAEAQALTAAGLPPQVVSLAELFARGEHWQALVAAPAAMVVFCPISVDEQVACAAAAEALAADGHRGWRVSAQAMFWPAPVHALTHAAGLHGAVMLRPASALVALVQELAQGRRPNKLPGLAWRMDAPGRGARSEVMYWPVASAPPPSRPLPLRAPTYVGLPVAPVLMSSGCTGACPGCVAGAAERHGWPESLWREGIAATQAEAYRRGAQLVAVQGPDPVGVELPLEPSWPEAVAAEAAAGGAQPLSLVKLLTDEVSSDTVSRLTKVGVVRVALRHRLRLPPGMVADAVATATPGPGAAAPRNQALQRALALLAGRGIAVDVHLLGWEPAPPLSELVETLAILRQSGPLGFRVVWLPHLTDLASAQPRQPQDAPPVAIEPTPAGVVLSRVSLAWPEIFHSPDGLARRLSEVCFFRHLLARLERRMGRSAATPAEREVVDQRVQDAFEALLSLVESALAFGPDGGARARMVEMGRALRSSQASAGVDEAWALLRRAAQRLAGRESLRHDGLRWTSSGHEACWEGWPAGAAAAPWPRAWWPLLAGFGLAAAAAVGLAVPGLGLALDGDPGPEPTHPPAPENGPGAPTPAPAAPPDSASPALPDPGAGQAPGPATAPANVASKVAVAAAVGVGAILAGEAVAAAASAGGEAEMPAPPDLDAPEQAAAAPDPGDVGAGDASGAEAAAIGAAAPAAAAVAAESEPPADEREPTAEAAVAGEGEGDPGENRGDADAGAPGAGAASADGDGAPDRGGAEPDSGDPGRGAASAGDQAAPSASSGEARGGGAGQAQPPTGATSARGTAPGAGSSPAASVGAGAEVPTAGAGPDLAAVAAAATGAAAVAAGVGAAAGAGSDVAAPALDATPAPSSARPDTGAPAAPQSPPGAGAGAGGAGAAGAGSGGAGGAAGGGAPSAAGAGAGGAGGGASGAGGAGAGSTSSRPAAGPPPAPTGPVPPIALVDKLAASLNVAMPPPKHPFQHPCPDPAPNSPPQPPPAPAIDLSMPSAAGMFATLVKLNFMTKGVMLPTSFSPSELVTSKPGDPLLQIGNLASLATNLYKSPSPLAIHVQTATVVGKKLEAFIDAVSRGICQGWNMTTMSIKFFGVIINGPVGMLMPGGMVAASPMNPMVMAGLSLPFGVANPAKELMNVASGQKYAKSIYTAIAQGFNAWVSGYTNSAIPFPGGAAAVGTMPPSPNVPVPLAGGSSPGEAMLSASALSSSMLSVHGPPGLHTLAIFDAFAKTFNTIFTVWKASNMIMNVIGVGGVAPPTGGPVAGALGNGGMVMGMPAA
ncbi:hypothetical protein [Haliangium sp.]|uniref:hypothetical protein n=1 Tax=Haliangium sp. TaxID=2663208 RepID=UPI003D0D186E